MKEPVKWGIVVGAAVAVQNVVFALAGWHTIYVMAFVFLVIAIAINITSVVVCLRRTAAGSSWAQQLGNGLVLGLVASALVFIGSWLVTAVAFPDYFTEMAEGYRLTFIEMGMSQEEIDRTVAGLAATTPLRSTLEGVVGTFVTSVVAAGIAGVWLRDKG